MRRIWPGEIGRIKNVLPLKDYIENDFLRAKTPFVPERHISTGVRRIVTFILQIFERWIGKKFWVEDLYRELNSIKKSTRSLLAYLIDKGIVINWECKVEQAHGQPQYVSSLTLGGVVSKEGLLICENGLLSGFGSATDPDASLVTALAESLERFASTQFSLGSLEFASINELKAAGRQHSVHAQVRPLKGEEFDAPVGWCEAEDIFSGQKTLVPANTVYMFYRWHFQEEPVFMDISSSGVAAQTSYEKALTLALYESFERDGFLMYWLNSLSPQQIELSSIQDDFVQQTVKQLTDSKFSVYLLDCKAEYKIPVLVMVTIDDINHGVSVHAVSGVDIDYLVRKLCADTLRWNLDYRPAKPGVNWSEIKKMEDREALWYGGYMREHIDFLISGQSISYDVYKAQFELPTLNFNELNYIKERLKDNGSEAYAYHYKNDLAEKAGLYVVRAIVPDLMPIHFSEQLKHLNVQRLYTFGQKMGYLDKKTTAETINKVPHPFI